MPSYSNPNHPEHKEWLIARRKRFVAILREGKRACKLLPEEREATKKLCDLVAANTKSLESDET